MIARFLTPEQAGEEMLDYARRYPIAFRELASFMGYHLNGTQEDIRSMGQTADSLISTGMIHFSNLPETP